MQAAVPASSSSDPARDAPLNHALEALDPTSPAIPAAPPQTQTAMVAGQELTVFVESPPLFEALLKDIVGASKRIWIEVYIFFNDPSCVRVSQALQAKAREGLDVRVFYDALGSASTPGAFFNEMIDAGVRVHAYHSLMEGLRRFRPFTILNRRDHRKIIVIDERIGYFGGMNLVENVQGDAREEKAQDKPTSSGWRDIHVRLVGPQQQELAISFERSWLRAQGQKPPRRSRAYRRALQATAATSGEEAIHFFDSGPGRRYSRAGRVFTRLIRKARHQVTLSMAYFIPVGAPMRALLNARRRGVRVRVIVPGKSDVAIVQRASCHLYDQLLRRGFRIYERRQRMLHSKTMVVDDQYTVVGSCNLDPRSLYINLEFLAVIRSQHFARIIARICRFEAKNSNRVTRQSCRRQSRWQRLLDRLAWAVRWWL
ncbi:MAG TPA: phosphatidylserine/phosphatidylglycerophosphate/cardiolipin synthase family protein [Phycisphaerae bacterium]|nr:phosphatidylserine/phosphatidylglycerophosphate/cardiolipin synthase family protein [Phycisphaerae bacterium]